MKLRSIAFGPILAVATLREGFGMGMYVIMVIGFIWGVVKIMQGGAAISRGEEGKMDIVGGIIIALAPIIMFFVFKALNMTGAAIDPTQIQGF